jgi:hypothetical protein
MPKAVLGVSILVVVDALAQQRRLPDWIANEERIPLGRNCQAPQLALPPGLGIEVIVLGGDEGTACARS